MRAILLLFILLSSHALSSDWGKWRKDDICAVTWEFINNTKQELLDRSVAVEKYTGAKVDIEFLHNANMDRKQQALHNKFLNFKTTEKDFHEYIVPYLVELEKNRALLATAEEKAAKIWDERNKKGEIKEYVTREAELYGTQIKSKRIGVVLDNSYSMALVLPKLRDQIKSKFEYAYFIEIYGSFIEYYGQKLQEKAWFYVFPESHENPFLKQWYCQSYPLESPHLFLNEYEVSNLQAFTALATVRKVDTIYWFTDLKDKNSDYGYEILNKLLKRYQVKLYVHTTGKQPNTIFRKIIKDSGGEIIKSRI